MQVRFVSAATPDRIAVVAALADKVWNEHYTGLLAPAQIAYMVDKFQSAGAIARQIAQEGYRYFLLELDGRRWAIPPCRPRKAGCSSASCT